MKKLMGNLLYGIGILLLIVFGLWSFLVNLRIVIDAAGFWGAVIGFVLLPVMFIAAPWYALIEWGEWFPLVLTYGGTIIAGLFFMTGKGMRGDL